MRHWIQHNFASLRRAREGSAYLEFAIALPFLLLLFLGSVEVTRYILIVQKVEKVSVTLADLVAQSQTMTTAELDQIITATGQVLQPYTFGTNSYAIITSVKKIGVAAARVNWQYAGGGSWVHASQIGTVGNVANLPAGFTMADNDNVIFAEVFYNFSPMLSSSILSSNMIYKVALYKPRLGDLSVLSMLLCTERSVV